MFLHGVADARVVAEADEEGEAPLWVGEVGEGEEAVEGVVVWGIGEGGEGVDSSDSPGGG